MTLVDLDAAPAEVKAPRGGRLPWVLFAATLAALVITLTAVLAARFRPPQQPEITVGATSLPGSNFVATATAWYRDGGSEDISSQMSQPWTPTHPLRLVTVVANVECEIHASGVLVAKASAADYRLAVCAWAV